MQKFLLDGFGLHGGSFTGSTPAVLRMLSHMAVYSGSRQEKISMDSDDHSIRGVRPVIAWSHTTAWVVLHFVR